MKRRINYALRTLIGPWLTLPTLGLEIAAFLFNGLPWLGEGMWTVDWFAIPLFIIGPLCAAGAAVDASRLSRPGNVHLVVSIPRPVMAYLRPAAWCAGPVVGLHLMTIAIAIIVGQVSQPSVGWPAMLGAAMVQCMSIVWFVAIGSAIGRLASPLLAGISAGGAGYVLTYIAGAALTNRPTFRVLDLGGATITMLGRAYNPGYLAGQAITFALTIALFVLLPIRSRSGHNVPTGRGTIAIILAAVTIFVSPAVFPHEREVNASRPPDYCVGAQPQICLHYEHRRYADLAVPLVQKLTKAASDAGYPAFVPERVMESSRNYRAGGHGDRSLWFPTETYEKGELSLGDVAYFMIEPGHCIQLQPTPDEDWTPPSMIYHERFFSLLATWLQIAGKDIGHTPVQSKILSPDEVKRTLDEFDRCELEGSM